MLGRRRRLGGLLVVLLSLQSPTANAQSRTRLEGSGSCAGVAGRYLAAIAGGRATLVSAAEFPGSEVADAALDRVTAHRGRLWRMSVGRIPSETSGCVAFDKDRFTWAGDLATYVQYLARELLTSAQRLDPGVRALAIGERSVRLAVSRPGIDTATLDGPEGAMLGYGRLSDPERYFFLAVPLDDGDRLLVRVFRNRGEPFGERSTEPLGSMLVAKGVPTLSATTPLFEVTWRVPGN